MEAIKEFLIKIHSNIYDFLYNTVYLYVFKKGFYPFILLGLIALFIIFIAFKYNPRKQLKKAYSRLNQRLINEANAVANKSKKTFDFNKIHDMLLQNGILFRAPWLDNPANYLALKFISGILLGVLMGLLVPILSLVGFALGYVLPNFVVKIINSQDNKKMQKDIQLIYNLILIQSKSHVSLTDALVDCVDMIDPEDKRLVHNLKVLKENLIGNKSFKEAIKIFNAAFDNQYIDSLCLTLIQAEESGLASDLLKDMNAQVQHFSVLRLNAKKEEMDTKVTIASLIFLASLLAIGMSAGFEEISEMLTMSGLF